MEYWNLGMMDNATALYFSSISFFQYSSIKGFLGGFS